MRRVYLRIISAAFAVLFASHACAQNEGANSGVENTGSAHPPKNEAVPELDAYPDVRDFLLHGKPGAAFNALQARQAAHENDPQFFYLLGILAMKAGDYHAAVSAFELVVIMQPENAGAWLDLAIASADAGNTVSAIAYFDYIEAQFHPPSALQAIIVQYRKRIAAHAKIASPWQYHAEAEAGVDTNANSGLQNSVLPLTLGTERIDLTLDPAYRARRDNYAQYGGGVSYKNQVDADLWEVGLSARQRSYAREHDFSTLDVNLSAGVQRPTVAGDTGLWLHLEHLSQGGNALLRNARAVAQVERPYGACRLGVSAETEWRRYASLTSLDANTVWGQAGIACGLHIAQIATQTTLIARAGIDNPIGVRPGGKTRRGEVLAQIAAPLGGGVRTEFSATMAVARDKDGYSPLLEQNAARNLQRRNLRLLLAMPLSATSEASFTVEDNHFISNLALFQQSGKSVGVGIRKRY